MRRLLVFALMLSLCPASVALAGPGARDSESKSWRGTQTLLQSGQRITRQDAKTRPAPDVRPALLEQTTLSQSGMSKGKKFLIGLGIAASFVGVALAIDGGVEDSTPSSLGQR